MGATLAFAIGLLVVGLVLFVIEAMIPSFGVIGVTGAIAAIAAVVLAFQTGPVGGFMFLILAVVGGPFAFFMGFKLLPKMPFGRNFILTGPGDSREQTVDAGVKHLEGKEGVAASMLRPTGIAVVDNERVAVQTEGEIIEKNSRVKVVKIVGNKVFVERV